MPPDRPRPDVDDAETPAVATPDAGAVARRTSSNPASASSVGPGAVQGRVRAALAAVRNLETLLRSPRVGTKVLRELQPELPATFEELRSAFAENAKSDGDEALRAFVSVRAKEVEDALAGLAISRARELDAKARLALERLVAGAATDLDAAGELLDMVHRAHADKRIDLAVSALGRASLELTLGIRPRRETLVRVDVPELEGVVSADARVVAPIVAIAAALARTSQADGAGEIVLRARCGPDDATFVVEPATSADAKHDVAPTRTMTLIPPTLATVREVAASMGGRFEVSGSRSTLTLPRVAR